MAGGKLTPRQKMINLMYLVFIAMLALNMSKEVLSAFGLMNEKFDNINTAQNDQNQKLATLLSQKASENAGNFADKFQKSKKIVAATSELYNFINDVKTKDIIKDFKPENGVLPYEQMDKSTVDELWFKGDGYSPRGNEIIGKIESYKKSMLDILGTDAAYSSLTNKLNKLFNLEKVTNKSGVKMNYLDYHFKGFPAVASVAKLTAMQNDLKTIENEAYNIFLGASYKEAASMKNFQAIVVLDKNAYFQGETVTGKVVLGRYDANTKPTSFSGPGKIENGQAIISMTAGGIGEQNIGGKFTFLEDGKEVPLEFSGKYVVVPRPNSATISADKMNVVYRGVDNPISVTFAGIPENQVSANAPGLSPAGGKGKYNLKPQSGTEVTITATGKMSDGKVATDKKVFRIKGLPSPTGKIRGEVAAKGSTANLESCQISAVLEDFDFPVGVKVKQFTVKVPGEPTIVVSGDRMDGRARAAIKKAKRGDVIVINNIKASFTGIGQEAKPSSACTFEIQ